MTNLGNALKAMQQKLDIENGTMAKEIGISSSTLSRIKDGKMPDAVGAAKIFLWLVQEKVF